MLYPAVQERAPGQRVPYPDDPQGVTGTRVVFERLDYL